MTAAARCRACGAAIVWVRTAANGKMMPLDATPNEAGNVEVYDGKAIVHPGPSMWIEGTLYMPHFATCPNWDGPRG